MWVCKYDFSTECKGEKYISCIDCILDRIKTEIKSLSNANPSYWHDGDMVDREEVLDIINKYKLESEKE